MFRGQVKCSGWTGGVVGNVYNLVTVEDCSASNFVQNNCTEDGSTVGGIVGGAGGVNVNRCFARNVISKPKANQYKGSIVGKTNRTDLSTSITNCTYWTDINADVIEHYENTPTQSGNVNYWDEGKTDKGESTMLGDATKSILGRENWYYFSDEIGRAHV